MNKIFQFFREHKSELLRSYAVVTILFTVGLLIESTLWRIIVFAFSALSFVILGFFSFSSAENDLERLKTYVEKMAQGDLQPFRSFRNESNGSLRHFSLSLMLLSGRLRQIVEKVQGLAGSVGSTSNRIVELSRVLLKSGQNQSTAAEKATKAMQEINVAIHKIAEGVDTLNQLGLSASSAALQLTASIEEVTRNASQVGEFARDTLESMGNMIRGIEEMETARQMLAAAASHTDQSMKNMHERIHEVTQKALESDDLARRAAEAARAGRGIVAEVEQEMGRIASTFQQADEVIGKLARRSDEIGQILNVITQVADQTNLLSLNAAILSAQAGVHGKGFAVVADEIRKLSSRTASSVQEIEGLISKVRVEIQQAVQLMREGRTRLEQGLQKGGEASMALTDILSSTSAARDRVADIANASRAQIEAELEVQSATKMIKERLEQITRIIQEQARVSNDVFLKADRTIELLKSVEKGIQEQNHGAKEVSHIVERLSETIQSIYHATSEQSITSSKVVQSVDSLRSALEAGTVTIRALNSTSLSLDQESYILKHELSHFRLPEPRRGGSLVIGTSSRVSMLDPAFAQYTYLVEAVYHFYEGLVDYGEGTDIRPCLAEHWEISDDGRVYLFRLKRGVKFHNGKELTAADVKASFERILHPGCKSPGSWVLETVEGSEEMLQGKAKQLSGFTILDPQTFRIRLRQPIPFFLDMLAQCYTYILPSELASRTKVLSEVCGTGPFKLDRFVPGKLLEMSRFEKYHDPPFPYLDRVRVEMGMEESAIAEGMRKGTIHLTADLQKQELSRFLQEPEWLPRLQTNVQLYTAFLVLNANIPPLQDLRVRQAISLAIDRERLVREVVGKERAMVARTLLPPGLPGHDSNAAGMSYDPVRARNLLKQAGVREGTRLEIWQTKAAANEAVLQVIRECLQQIGLNLEIRFLEPDVFQRSVQAGQVPIRLTKWVADYPDPDNFLYITFNSRNGVFNNIGFRNKEFDQLTQEARCLADVQERIRLYQKAERIWLENCPCVVLYHSQAVLLHQENVQRCIPHFTQPIIRVKKIWLSQ